ncbi:MAG: hypothetical protein OEZ34_14450 [Spirochaetia bacterium]|nr:hypothetical protein [Spirochaetia bacterium]
MKIYNFIFTLTALFFLGLSVDSASAEVMKLADDQFAKKLCHNWNKSILPVNLGSTSAGGNGWIDHVTSKRVPEKQKRGYQKIVLGRFDCNPEWKKIELVIERQSNGLATCTSAGFYDGQKVTWQIIPKTKDYFKYEGGFQLSLWKLDSKGDYETKIENKENFMAFFQLVANLALESDYYTGCGGINEKSIIKSKSGYLKITKLTERRMPNAKFKLADIVFAKNLCTSWNSSKLPELLGSETAGGNGWVDTVVRHNVPEPQPSGYQKIVSGRSDCKPEWPKFELVIKRNHHGKAICTSSGLYDGTRVTWHFLPTTEDWFHFEQGFALSLWRANTIGDFIVSMKNYKNFELFFNIASGLSLQSDYIYGCGGMDIEKVEQSRNMHLKKKQIKR